MNDESERFFLIGLKKYIKDHKAWTQEKFANGVATAQYFSKLLNFKANLSADVLSKIREKLDVDIEDIVLIGKQVGDNKQTFQPATEWQTTDSHKHQPHAGESANNINPLEVLASVSVLVSQHYKNDERMRFWRTMFDSLPVPTLIIKNGIVIFQNTKSRTIGLLTGSPICENCACDGCMETGEDSTERYCPITEAQAKSQPASGQMLMREKMYQVEVTPSFIDAIEYYLATAVEIKTDTCLDRRFSKDRRSHTREDNNCDV